MVNDRMYRSLFNVPIANVDSGMRCAPLHTVLFPFSLFAQSWQQMPEFPGSARDDASAFVCEDQVYIGTGMQVGWTLTNDWWRFDPWSAEWYAVASLPSSARQHATAWSAEGKGYLFGGIASDGTYLNELWMYDPVSQHWSAKAPLPGVGRHSSTSFVLGGLAFIALGRTGPFTSVTPELWSYDPVTDSWHQRADYPGVSRLLSVAFSDGHRGYVMGGQDAMSTGLDEAYAYDHMTDSWSEVRAIEGLGRFGACGAFGSSIGAVFGGAHTYVPCCLDECLAYSPLTGEWYDLPALPMGDRKGAIATFIPGYGFFFGTGIESDSIRHSDCWLLAYDLGISDVDEMDAIVHPNPAFDHVTPSLPSRWPRASFQLMDVLGHIVLEGVTAHQKAISVAALSPGPFFLRLWHENEMHMARFIKLRE